MFETLSRHPNIAPLLQRYASMTAMEQAVVKLCALILAGLLLYSLAWSPAKEFMDKYDIPTAKYGNFSRAEEAIDGLKNFDYPLGIKGDGLAAGKGVVICKDSAEAEQTIYDMIANKKFGESGSNIVIEEFLEGTEAS